MAEELYEKVPGGQSLHVDCPETPDLVPAKQLRQTAALVAPISREKKPAEQFLQVVCMTEG